MDQIENYIKFSLYANAKIGLINQAKNSYFLNEN